MVFNPVVPPNPNAIQIPDSTNIGLSALAGAISNLGKGLEKYRAMKAVGPQAQMLGQIMGNPQFGELMRQNAEAAIMAGANPGSVISGMGDQAAAFIERQNEYNFRSQQAKTEFGYRSDLQSQADTAAMDRQTARGVMDVGQAAFDHAVEMAEIDARNRGDLEVAKERAQSLKDYGEAMRDVAGTKRTSESTINYNKSGIPSLDPSAQADTPTTMFERFLKEDRGMTFGEDPNFGKAKSSIQPQPSGSTSTKGGLQNAQTGEVSIDPAQRPQISDADAALAGQMWRAARSIDPGMPEEAETQMGALAEELKKADDPAGVMGRMKELDAQAAQQQATQARIAQLEAIRAEAETKLYTRDDPKGAAQMARNIEQIDSELEALRSGNPTKSLKEKILQERFGVEPEGGRKSRSDKLPEPEGQKTSMLNRGAGAAAQIATQVAALAIPRGWNAVAKTRDQLPKPTLDAPYISLDFNDADNTSAKGIEVVIPDGLDEGSRAHVEQYVALTADFFKRHGVDAPVRGIRTKSENGRGVSNQIHTEPFFVKDTAARSVITKHAPEYARILAATLGKIPGATFIAPHKTDDTGAADGDFNERDFALSVLIPELQKLAKDA